MADPETDHGFVYIEGDYVDILASPFFDVKLGLDMTVNGYIERIRYTLVRALELQLGMFPRSEPEHDDNPLHPSYVALQRLYPADPIFPPPVLPPALESKEDWASDSSDTDSAAAAEVHPVPPPSSSFIIRYWRIFCLTVALAIVCQLVLLIT